VGEFRSARLFLQRREVRLKADLMIGCPFFRRFAAGSFSLSA
jgi:hypothetical protein